MGYKKISILGVNFTIAKKSDILEEVRKYLKKVQSSKFKVQKKEIKTLIIFTPNPEIVTFAQKNPVYKQIVNSAQINIPDGYGICWAARKIYGVEIVRLSGTDLMLDLCELSAQESFTVGLIGGRDGVAVDAAECLKRTYPGIKVEVLELPEIQIEGKQHAIGTGFIHYPLSLPRRQAGIIHSGNGKKISANRYLANLAGEIVRKKINILFVALGFPKQELFISILHSQFSILHSNRSLVLMSVGGAFDYISGRVPRAPVWTREKGLEWLYRLIREPWRIGRQLKGAEFFLKLILQGNALCEVKGRREAVSHGDVTITGDG